MVILNKSSKIISLFILLLFVGTTFSLLVKVDAIGPGGSVTYSGYVRDMSTNPISGATVRLTIDDDLVPVWSETTSSGTGYYTVTRSYEEATPPVSISLAAVKTGYVFGSYGDIVEPGSYTHNFYLEADFPAVGWVSPANNQIVTFTPSNNLFNFTYSAENIDHTRLYIGPAGSSPTIQFGTDYTNEGSSISKTVDIGAHMGDFYGLVRADLRGYVSSSVAVTATRTFNFSKQISIESELLESGREDLGSRLMLILYDPPGDNSYSTWTHETSVVVKKSFEFEAGIIFEGKVGVEFFDSGLTSRTTIDASGGVDWDWQLTVNDIEELSSSINTADRELVGPGYGDLYYGELQIYVWEIHADKITYADSTVAYTDPLLIYGVEYSDAALVSHQYAPDAWKQQNPNLNATLIDDSNIVNWIENDSVIQGGTGYRDVTHEVTDTAGWDSTFTFEISHSTEAKLQGTGTKITGRFKIVFEYDHEETDSIKTHYYIHDDDSEDIFHYDVGTDLRFGTPIFRNFPTDNILLQSCSSTPWEYNTRDILSPETTYPVVTFNTDGDSYSPSEGDTPLVELTITDESEITVASLIYSHDDGAHWNVIVMEERLGDPDSWYANLPGHEHGTEVLWYIFTTDSNANSKTVLDVDLDYFSYTVVNRPCDVTLTSPNGGGTFSESILVEWSGSDLDDDSLTYSIGYRVNGGSWTLITSGLTNTSYLWDISQIADSDTVSVIVYADDGYGSVENDDSDFVFSIDNVDIPEATIIYPLASFTYQGIISITWSVEDPDEYVTGFSIYYSASSGTPTWILIDDTIAADLLTFDWNTNSSIVYSTDIRLKIEVQNSLAETVEDISGIFTIDNRPSLAMNLINPNGGEVITTSCLINWNLALGNPAIIYQIKLEYSINGSEWIIIASDLTGTSYEWNTTALPSGPNYRVRITLTATYLGVNLDTIIDISETAFTIIQPSDIPTILNNIPLFVTIVTLMSIAIVPLVTRKKRS